jgi:hypothetical protein
MTTDTSEVLRDAREALLTAKFTMGHGLPGSQYANAHAEIGAAIAKIDAALSANTLGDASGPGASLQPPSSAPAAPPIAPPVTARELYEAFAAEFLDDDEPWSRSKWKREYKTYAWFVNAWNKRSATKDQA